jgi:hypothetical protein
MTMSTTATAPKRAKVKLSRERLRQLTEIERQNYYTDQLDDETYEYPLFSGKQAVLSQRRSGYRTSAKAAREIIDNALEAGAKNVWVCFDRPVESSRARHERKNAVSAIAFIDDGPGMSRKMARFALTWGGGTHHEDPVKIGKFGFGLPNSSINQTKRVEVYSRTDAGKPWFRAVLDITDLPDHGLVSVHPAEEADPPKFVQDYIEAKKISLETGTIVVWIKPDRLTYTKASTLKEHFLDDFGTTYRYLLPHQETDAQTGRSKLRSAGEFRLMVEDVMVEPVDPFFLTPGCRLYVPPNEREPKKGGAWCTYERMIPVKYYVDDETGAKRLERLKDVGELQSASGDPNVLGVGTITIRIARFPYGFVLGERQHRKTDAGKRFEIRMSRRGMCFVRSGREIETFDAYPRSKHDKESGLGDWPHISGYAYHFGVEVRFDPDLDEVFNVGNDKQTIRPIDDFWRIMADRTEPEVGLDAAIHEEDQYQQKTRKAERQARREPQITADIANAPAIAAVTQASTATGKSGPLPDNRRDESKKLEDKAIQDLVEKTGQSVDKAREAIEDEAKRKKYAVEFFESRGGVFYEPSLGNGLQRIARINKLHPFYEVFYSRVAAMDDPIARHSIIVLLLTLAESELMADDVLREFYETQRESAWSPFLKLGLKKLEELEPETIEQDDSLAE